MAGPLLVVVLVVRLISNPLHPPIEVQRFATEAECREAMGWDTRLNLPGWSNFLLTCEVRT